MAEREGFEPSDHITAVTRLAGECLQPLGHLSICGATRMAALSLWKSLCGAAFLAEGEGFEPPRALTDPNGFQDRISPPSLPL